MICKNDRIKMLKKENYLRGKCLGATYMSIYDQITFYTNGMTASPIAANAFKYAYNIYQNMMISDDYLRYRWSSKQLYGVSLDTLKVAQNNFRDQNNLTDEPIFTDNYISVICNSYSLSKNLFLFPDEETQKEFSDIDKYVVIDSYDFIYCMFFLNAFMYMCAYEAPGWEKLRIHMTMSPFVDEIVDFLYNNQNALKVNNAFNRIMHLFLDDKHEQWSKKILEGFERTNHIFTEKPKTVEEMCIANSRELIDTTTKNIMRGVVYTRNGYLSKHTVDTDTIAAVIDILTHNNKNILTATQTMSEYKKLQKRIKQVDYIWKKTKFGTLNIDEINTDNDDYFNYDYEDNEENGIWDKCNVHIWTTDEIIQEIKTVGATSGINDLVDLIISGVSIEDALAA